MLTEKDMAELNAMTSDYLAGVMRLMRYQMVAKFLVGDRDRSTAVHDAAQAIISGRRA